MKSGTRPANLAHPEIYVSSVQYVGHICNLLPVSP
jgi:hypothetical protein